MGADVLAGCSSTGGGWIAAARECRFQRWILPSWRGGTGSDERSVSGCDIDWGLMGQSRDIRLMRGLVRGREWSKGLRLLDDRRREAGPCRPSRRDRASSSAGSCTNRSFLRETTRKEDVEADGAEEVETSGWMAGTGSGLT